MNKAPHRTLLSSREAGAGRERQILVVLALELNSGGSGSGGIVTNPDATHLFRHCRPVEGPAIHHMWRAIGKEVGRPGTPPWRSYSGMNDDAQRLFWSS
jgi:hypothetical protein